MTVFFVVCTKTFLLPAKVVTEMVTVPAAALASLTSPPIPRFCQSSFSCCCLAATSDCFITTTRTAISDFPSSEALPCTNTRSPFCKSSTVIGVAFFKSVAPGAIRTTRTFSGRAMLSVFPSSVASVRLVPLSDLISPTALARGPGAGACCGALCANTATTEKSTTALTLAAYVLTALAADHRGTSNKLFTPIFTNFKHSVPEALKEATVHQPRKTECGATHWVTQFQQRSLRNKSESTFQFSYLKPVVSVSFCYERLSVR